MVSIFRAKSDLPTDPIVSMKFIIYFYLITDCLVEELFKVDGVLTPEDITGAHFFNELQLPGFDKFWHSKFENLIIK